MSPSRRLLLWLLAPVPLFLPLLWVSTLSFFGNSDALFYSNILAMMGESLKGGVILPRWFAAANAGLGSPVMLYYTPLAYQVTALIVWPFTALALSAGTQLLIGIYAAQVVGGYTSYRWLARSFPPRIAMTGSVLFILLPYKLIYIYLHLNLAQLWALAFLPVWMIAAEAMPMGRQRPIALYALALACVYYCHPLTVIAFGAAPAIHVLWFGRRQAGNTILKLISAHLLGAGLCLMHLLPARLYMGWIYAERFKQEGYNWSSNFFHVDVFLCAYYGVIALLMAYALARVPSLKAWRGRGYFWVGVIGAAWFLTQRESYWVWTLVTPLQYLQFPAARLHAPALMGAVWLICLWLSHWRDLLPLAGTAFRPGGLFVLIGCFALATIFRLESVYAGSHFASPDYIGDAQTARIMSAEPISVYETRWGCIKAGIAYSLYEQGQVPPHFIPSGQVQLTQEEWSPPGHIGFRATAKGDGARLTLGQCYFPLWKATDESGKDVALLPDPHNGLIALDLPRGEHHVSLTFALAPLEAACRWISLLSLALSLVLLARKPSRAL